VTSGSRYITGPCSNSCGAVCPASPVSRRAARRTPCPWHPESATAAPGSVCPVRALDTSYCAAQGPLRATAWKKTVRQVWFWLVSRI